MKMIVVLALAAMAMAEPEADPALLYRSYGYGAYPYAGAYGYRTYGAYPYTYGYYGKRSADAEPEADADALYGYYGYPYGYRAYGAYGYRAYGAYPYAYGAYYGKRSADAEPEAEADPALLYTTAHVANPVTSYVASPLVSALTPAATIKTVNPVVNTVYTAAHHAPVVSSVRTVAPVVSSVKTVVPATYTAGVHYPVSYTAGVVPAVHSYSALTHTPVVSVNNVPVTHTVAKREAEAEADPALVYTSGLVNPVAYTAHHVAAPVAYTAGVHTVAAPVTYTTHQVAAPVVAKAVVPAVNTYTVPVAATHVAKTADHGVVAAPQGLVHSSHAGICLNNVGVQVPC